MSLYGSGHRVVSDNFRKVWLRMPGETPSSIKHLYLGVELEHERATIPRDRFETEQKFWRDEAKFGICKTDGSLNYDRGYEINTLPASLNFHRNSGFWDEYFSRFGTTLSSPRASVGMHVHVSRKTFGAKEDSKVYFRESGSYDFNTGRTLTKKTPIRENPAIMRLVHLINNPNLAQLITIIAERAPNNYCTRGKSHFDAGIRNGGRWGKYSALNTSPETTVEFRMFKSVKDKESVFRNLEFVHSASEYVKQATDDNCGPVGYMQYIKANANDYPHLFGYLTAPRNLVPAKISATKKLLKELVAA